MLESYHPLPVQGMFIVRVGAHRNADPAYSVNSGDNYYGPLTHEDALEFEYRVITEHKAQLANGRKAVYGELEVERIPIMAPRSDGIPAARGSPIRAARNWVLDS